MRTQIITGANTTSNVVCGVSGWNHRDWVGTVLPRPAENLAHPLELIADRLDAMEIDTTFREWVRPEVVRLWGARVIHNPRFRFSALLHRQFTHERNLDPEAVRRYIDSLRPLDRLGRLGCVLMQLPASFRFTSENRDFLIQLRRAFHMFPLVAELRHASWTAPEALGALIDHRIGFCNLDQPDAVRATPPTAHLTWRIGYVRLHGRTAAPSHWEFDDKASERSGKSHLFSTAELLDWQRRVERFAGYSEQTFVVFANDAGGRAMVNALQMKALLGPAEPFDAPRRPAAAAAPLLAARATAA